MTISFTRYVDIVSGVAGANQVGNVSLGLRCFTDNALLPPQSFITFTNAADVGTYFGFTSNEYYRALFYFGWVSKKITAPKQMDFARWVDTATAPKIFGAYSPAPTLAALNGVTAGAFTLIVAGTPHVISAINLSAAGSLAAVAADIQTAVAGVITGSTCTYDAVRGCFDLVVGTVTTNQTLSVTDGAQTPAALLGWISGTGLIVSPGSAVETLTQCLTTSAAASNNFGSFLFMPAAGDLTLIQNEEVATWNAGNNVQFIFTLHVTPANAAAWSAALLGFEGTAIALDSPSGSQQYPSMCVSIILAATDYTQRNATQNYMYQQFPGLVPSVLDDADANTYDALRINYYGQTQEAGQTINFYQRGILMGGATAPVDMNTYANEQWLKANIGVGIINLQLALSEIPANYKGRAMILSQIQTSINAALFNGVISVGKTLTNTQILTINEFTGDPNAWRQVQNAGYWVDVEILPYVNSQTQLTEYKAVYTLVYSKDDVVRLVTGSDVLI
jgi:hypothetical protein